MRRRLIHLVFAVLYIGVNFNQSVFGGNTNPSLVFSVSDFGAMGDGVVDDREAIQKTINAAIAAGKGATVLFVPGKHIVWALI